MDKIIDVHHHIVPKKYTKSLSEMGVNKGLGVQLPNWNPKKTISVMDKNNIGTSIISISAPGVYFKDKDNPIKHAKELSYNTNEICARLIEDYPGRFGAFATLPLPDVDAAIEELIHAIDILKLDGVILLSNYDGYYLGDPKFNRLFAELNHRKIVVFVHPDTPPGIEQSHLGLPEAMVDVCFDTTRTALSLMVNGVLKYYPDVKFILAHAGGAIPFMAARVGTLSTLTANLGKAQTAIAEGLGFLSSHIPQLKDKMTDQLDYYLRFKKNVLPEGSDYFLKKFYFDTALAASPHSFASLETLVDSSHILFGSDFIFATNDAVPMTVNGIEEYEGFNQEDIFSIEKNNALKLFPRLKEYFD